MHPEQIMAALRMKGTTAAALADELGVDRSTVSHVVRGRAVSARVQQRISEVIGIAPTRLWPPKKASGLRRAKSATSVGREAA